MENTFIGMSNFLSPCHQEMYVSCFSQKYHCDVLLWPDYDSYTASLSVYDILKNNLSFKDNINIFHFFKPFKTSRFWIILKWYYTTFRNKFLCLYFMIVHLHSWMSLCNRTWDIKRNCNLGDSLTKQNNSIMSWKVWSCSCQWISTKLGHSTCWRGKPQK